MACKYMLLKRYGKSSSIHSYPTPNHLSKMAPLCQPKLQAGPIEILSRSS